MIPFDFDPWSEFGVSNKVKAEKWLQSSRAPIVHQLFQALSERFSLDFTEEGHSNSTAKVYLGFLNSTGLLGYKLVDALIERTAKSLTQC